MSGVIFQLEIVVYKYFLSLENIDTLQKCGYREMRWRIINYKF